MKPKKSSADKRKPVVPPVEATPPPSQKPPAPSLVDEWKSVIARAKKGDASVLPRVRDLLDANPGFTESAGDYSKVVERAWLDVVARGDLIAREALIRDIEKLRADLSGLHPTKTEQLLVAQIIACFLESKQAQHSLADRALAGSSSQDTYWLKRAEVAQRKYLASLKMLATLRANLPQGLAPLNSTKLYIPDFGRKQA